MNAVRNAFRPEFLNRLDEIIIFNRLTPARIKEIVLIQLNELQNRLKERHITLTWNDEVLEWLASIGYDPLYGARPLKRVIQKYIQDPLSTRLISGDIKDNSTVSCTMNNNGEIVFSYI